MTRRFSWSAAPVAGLGLGTLMAFLPPPLQPAVTANPAAPRRNPRRLIANLSGPATGPTYPASVPIRLQIDGRVVEIEDEGRSLLDVLREDLGLRSAKDGCSPQGQCGCCTILVDGSPRVACVTPARRLVGRAVTTIDGLPPGVRDSWAEAFSATGASQCGFCTPGILMTMEAFLRDDPDPTPERIRSALAGNLCRCTGYQNIIAAVRLAADRQKDATSS